MEDLCAKRRRTRPVAQLAFADFYHRRLRPQDEIGALSVIANAPADASENFTPAPEQRSWHAFTAHFRHYSSAGLAERCFDRDSIVSGLPAIPRRHNCIRDFLEYLIAQKEYAAANQLIAEYQRQFPGDEIFQVKAKALVEYRQGSIQQGLAVYEKSFQPLWDPGAGEELF